MVNKGKIMGLTVVHIRGLLGLWTQLKEKRMENATNHSSTAIISIFHPEPTQPMFFNAFVCPKKGEGTWFLAFYGCFLSSSNASKAPTMTIAMIMPTTAGTK